MMRSSSLQRIAKVYRINLLPHSLAATFCWLVVTTAHSDSPAELVPDRSSVDYMTQIKPILSEKCYSCHGSLRQESGLRLETVDLMLAGGDSGPVVHPGHPAESMLLQRVHGQNGERMPPTGEGSPLKPDQVKLIETWILEGCKTPAETVPPKPADHWAFQKLVLSEAQPAQQRTDKELATRNNPIDELLSRKRSQAGLDTVPPAPRKTLIRRLYLDLIGLPPTQKQLNDKRPLPQIIDGLLTSPQHGERWARHWMDVWRYSDWYGLGKQLRNSQKHLWHWRDWIIKSLNDDKGYDRMIVEMLAGDEAAPDNVESITGTGFLARNYYLFNRTTWLDSTIEHTSKAFLGLTVNCAKCHDHKYDPITQLDYYRLRAIFEPHQVRLDPVPGESDFEKGGLPRVFDDDIHASTYLHVRGDPKSPDKSNPIAPGVPSMLSSFEHQIKSISLPRTAYSPGTRAHVLETRLANAKSRVESSRLQQIKAREEYKRLKADAANQATQEPEHFLFDDDFSTLDPKKWALTGDGWKHQQGKLSQTKATREQQSARLLVLPPRDFDLRCKYTTTGGTTYKSVTIRFDQNDGSDYSNYVYTSAHAPAPKVQVAYTRNGESIYPTEGRKPFQVHIGKSHELRFAVRGSLVNVWLDGQFMVAYQYPNRRDGYISLSGFDATVDFDSIHIENLDAKTVLKKSSNTNVETVNEAEQAIRIAETEYRAAVAEEKMFSAMLESVLAGKAQSDETAAVEELACLAGERQVEWKLASLEHEAAKKASDPKQLANINQKIEKTKTELVHARNNPTRFTPIKAAFKALESPADKEENYPASYSPTSTGRRYALAKWITSDQNPLTARVAVNHVWLRHFGYPLVDSTFDFGLRAPEPLHRDLLDLLAVELINSGWSFRHLHRLIVSSDTYALSASAAKAKPATVSRDPNNDLFWRMNSRRMESQVVRDSLLLLAGELDQSMGGPPIAPLPEARRRSIYFRHSRDQKSSFLEMFDNADILQCYRRSESIVPQQALALSNSRLAIEMSDRIAERLAHSLESPETGDFIDATFNLILARQPSQQEKKECQEYFEQMQLLKEVANPQQIRTRFVQAILNHNDFITIR